MPKWKNGGVFFPLSMGCNHTDLPRVLAIVQMPSVFPNTFVGQLCTK